MKLFKALSAACLVLALAACNRVGNGEVGVRYHTMGSDTGVEETPLGMGWYVTGPGTGIETFATFAQTRNWTDENQESLKFADSGGLPITAEMGITYQVDPLKAPYLYKRYRRGVDEITDTFIHNMVRDSLIEHASTMPIEDIYGPGRSKLLAAVQADVAKQVGIQGIEIQKVYWIGNLGLPDTVKASINSKIVATQKAQQIENEVQQSKAQAQKDVAEAQGKAAAVLANADGQAKANKELAESLTPSLVEYMKIQKWNGQLPRVAGAQSIISLNADTLK